MNKSHKKSTFSWSSAIHNLPGEGERGGGGGGGKRELQRLSHFSKVGSSCQLTRLLFSSFVFGLGL